MKEVIIRFATLNVQNVISYVYVAIFVVWLTMVLSALMSLRSQEIAFRWKLIWAALIIVLPIVGMAGYAIFCLVRADYPTLHQMGLFRKNPERYGLKDGGKRSV